MISNAPHTAAWEVQDIHSWQFVSPQSALSVALNAAQKLLPALVKADTRFALQLGFSSLQEVNPTALGVKPPFAVFRISLDQLKNYNSQQQNPISLLLDKANFLRWSIPVPARMIFPITTSGVVKSSVRVSMPTTSSKWRMEWLGSPELIRQLLLHGAPPDYFVVWIPSLDRYYLGTIVGSDFKIKFIFKEVMNNTLIAEGEVRPAKDVFSQLKIEAERIDARHAPR